jgi:hypothetical protein
MAAYDERSYSSICLHVVSDFTHIFRCFAYFRNIIFQNMLENTKKIGKNTRQCGRWVRCASADSQHVPYAHTDQKSERYEYSILRHVCKRRDHIPMSRSKDLNALFLRKYNRNPMKHCEHSSGEMRGK